MATFVIITGTLGVLFALGLAFWHYGKAVRESHLVLLAKWFRDEPESFKLFMYQQSIKLTKKEINNEQHKL